MTCLHARIAFALTVLQWSAWCLGQERVESAAPAHPARTWVARALSEADRIESQSDRAEALGTIAGAAAESGDREAYHRAITMAMAAAKETDEFTMGAAMWSIAESQARAGDVGDAMATASQAGNGAYVALAHAAAARAHAERSRHDAYRQQIDAAIQAAEGLDDPLDQGWASYYIAEAQLAAGELDAAKRTAEACKEVVSRAETMANVAGYQGQGQTPEAAAALLLQVRATLDEARRTVPQEDLYLDFALAKLAEAQSCGGDTEVAMLTLADVSDPASRSLALIRMCQLARSRGDAELANKLLAEAITATQAVADDYERATTCTELAEARVVLGEIEGLGMWVDTLASPLERAFACLGIANGLLTSSRE